MKNLLITGGTGFFGRALLRHIDLVKRTDNCLPFDEVTVVSRSPESFHRRFPELANLSWLSWHKGDVLIPSTLPQSGKFHFIIHAASDSTDIGSMTLLQTYRQIVDGTENMLKLAATYGSNRFLLASSGSIYGPQPEGMDAIPETYIGMPDPLNPSNAYGVAKLHAEHLCAQYGREYGIETVIARCFAFVGEDLPRNYHFAIGNFIRDALERSVITINGNGRPIRSYMYQSDLATWLLTLLTHGRSCQAYNVGSDEVTSIAEAAYLVRDILSPDKLVEIKGGLLEVDEYRGRYVPNISKAKLELGLKISVPLAKAIHLSL
jgi:UDP-glucuronate decarboxylase